MMPASNGSAVRAERVSRHYQMGSALIRAVDDVTLEVRSGEFLALLGSSGSGKSTLLNLIAGLDRPTSGAIFAQGRNLFRDEPARAGALSQPHRRNGFSVFQPPSAHDPRGERRAALASRRSRSR